MRVTVSLDGDHWIVTIDDEVVTAKPTRAEAVEAGRSHARANRPSQLVICRRDGTVQRMHRYPSQDRAGVKRQREEIWRSLREPD